MLSVFEMFKVGVGPSSSHTVGPMVAARRFALELEQRGLLEATERVQVRLFGSLGATGHGHGSDRAVLAGLEGAQADTVDTGALQTIWERVTEAGRLQLLGRHPVTCHPTQDVRLLRGRALPAHPNALGFQALRGHEVLFEETYYSIGGGFVVREDEMGRTTDALPAAPHSFRTMAELLAACAGTGKSIARMALENEMSAFAGSADPEAEVMARLDAVWAVMEGCVERGLATEGVLPGGLKVPRRAAALAERLENETDPDALSGMDWLSCYAMAVNEENAAGGRVVTAPTNGAAGVIPAVLYYLVHRDSHHLADAALHRSVVRFLLTAGAIGMVIKNGASLSGAEVGCQGEVGSACAMAAAGLVAFRGGSPRQVENAAEIAMEHQLGLTCDPIGGLVQIPCIERNGVAACHAASAARTALHGDGTHLVSFDEVVATMRQTGLDMRSKYRETSRGGLAVNTALC